MSKRKVLKAGVIGAGNIGQNAHLPAYQNLEDTELIALCDTDEKRLKEVAKRFGVVAEHLYTDYKKMYQNENLDVVSICTPTWAHYQQTIDAIKAGYHVICEKPMAMNAKEATVMVDLAEKENRVLALGFNNRFRLESRTLKKHIDNGLLGEIYYAKSGWLRRRGNPHGWFTKKELSGGGPLIDCGVHALDLTWWFMGCPKPVSITASTYCKFGNYDVDGIGQYWAMSGNEEGEFDTEDLATAFIKFANGATMVFDVSWALNGQNTGIYASVFGEKAGATFDPFKIYGEIDNNIFDFEPKLNKGINAQEAKVANFIKNIKGEEELVCTAEQGLMITKMVDAIYKSAETGDIVQL